MVRKTLTGLCIQTLYSEISDGIVSKAPQNQRDFTQVGGLQDFNGILVPGAAEML